MLFVGTFPVKTAPDNTEKHKADSRHQNIRKCTANRFRKTAAVQETAQQHGSDHERIQDIHGECQKLIYEVQNLYTEFCPPDISCDFFVKYRVVVVFHNLLKTIRCAGNRPAA